MVDILLKFYEKTKQKQKQNKTKTKQKQKQNKNKNKTSKHKKKKKKKTFLTQRSYIVWTFKNSDFMINTLVFKIIYSN